MTPPLHYSAPPTDVPTDLLGLAKSINASLGWHRHPRNGKVARLPELIRNRVNLLLEEGLPYRDIIRKLQSDGGLPYTLSEMNLSNWYRGGYLDWLREKSKAAVGLPPRFDITKPVFAQAAAMKAAHVQRFEPPAVPAPRPVPGGLPEFALISATPAH